MIQAQRHRTQDMNRRDAMERLAELVRKAAEPRLPTKTRVPRSATRKRLEAKKANAGRRRCSRAGPRGLIRDRRKWMGVCPAPTGGWLKQL